MQTVGGRAVSFLTPDPSSIDIGDICRHLSGLRRFNNATCRPWTVAAHSRLVHLIVKESVPHDYAAQLWAIMHDFHEFASGDLTSPLQKAIEALLPSGWASPIKTIQDALDRAIAQRFEIDWQDVLDVKPIVKRADIVACATEKAQFMVREPMPWADMPPPYDIELVPVGEAQTEWLLRNDFEKALTRYRAWKLAGYREAAE
jgi:5'-deoxynucleotidase YfbR-like HD superfamily hydrolase